MYQVPIRPGESWMRARVRRHVYELLRLALPVIVARAGLILMALVDTLFVGRYGSADLAHLSIANPLNALVNWLLVFGAAGFPELGAMGAAWASTASRVFLAASLVAYVWWMRDRDTFGIRRWQGWRWRDWTKQRQLGYGGGLSI